MKEKIFKWSQYISKLNDMPKLIQSWEKELVTEIFKVMPKDKYYRILEIGCSNGRWLRWFKKHYNCETFGVDMDMAGKNMSNFILGNGLSLPFKNNSFDIVFSMGLIEHFSLKTQRRKLIEEHVRVAKKGFIMITHPNTTSSLRWCYIKFALDYRLGHKHYKIAPEEMKEHFEQTKIRTLSSKFIGWFFDLGSNKIPKIFTHRFTSDDYVIIGEIE